MSNEMRGYSGNVDWESFVSYRKIIHIDMDAFYASIEQRDHSEYRGKPVAVGRGEMRGVVAAASYEARKYGVRSAMPSMRAKKLCPQLIFAPVRMDVYKKTSLKIREIFHRYTDLVEPLSLDEAFLDVTENKAGIPLAVDVAKRIKREIWDELSLTASAGVSYNKFLAKIASDYRKPNGLFSIHPTKALEFIEKLPIEAFWGVGKATAKRMRELGITNGADLRKRNLEFLAHYFGKAGAVYYHFSRGEDSRRVEASRVRKSVGCEYTFRQDRSRDEVREEVLPYIVRELVGRLDRTSFDGHTLTLKVKYPDFTQKTRSITVADEIRDENHIIELSRDLLEGVPAEMLFRLVGLSVSNRNEDFGFHQMELGFGK